MAPTSSGSTLERFVNYTCQHEIGDAREIASQSHFTTAKTSKNMMIYDDLNDVPFEPTSAGLLPKHLAQVGLGRGKDPCGKCSRRNSWRLVAPAPDLRWLVIDDGQKHWKSWHFVYKDHWLTKIQEKPHADVSWWPITFIWSWISKCLKSHIGATKCLIQSGKKGFIPLALLRNCLKAALNKDACRAKAPEANDSICKWHVEMPCPDNSCAFCSNGSDWSINLYCFYLFLLLTGSWILNNAIVGMQV